MNSIAVFTLVLPGHQSNFLKFGASRPPVGNMAQDAVNQFLGLVENVPIFNTCPLAESKKLRVFLPGFRGESDPELWVGT